MRILVIGGTGFIGRDVVNSLSRMGHDLILFNREAPTFQEKKGPVRITSELKEIEYYRPQIRDLAPEVVLVDMFHFSASDARRVSRTVKGISRRIVVLSGTDVYLLYGRLYGIEPGPVQPVPAAENAPLRTINFPGLGEYDKLNMEPVILADQEMPGTVIRLPPVYGPRSLMHRLFFYLKRMDDRRPHILLSRQLSAWQWTHGYVENVAHAVALACIDERASGRIYNVGDPNPISMAAWVEIIGKAAGWDGDIIIFPRRQVLEISPFATAFINTDQDAVVDSSRIRSELNYAEPVDFEQAVAKTIAWERSHPIPPQLMGPGFFDYDAEDRLVADFRKSEAGKENLI
ncbi:MAG: NAD-dependent epimerase/dehydratase family protein [Desulfobacterales bacterium]